MGLPQCGEVAKQRAIDLEVLGVEEEVQRPGDSIVKSERSPEKQVIERSELRI
jgi:hypothetical protein